MVGHKDGSSIILTPSQYHPSSSENVHSGVWTGLWMTTACQGKAEQCRSAPRHNSTAVIHSTLISASGDKSISGRAWRKTTASYIPKCLLLQEASARWTEWIFKCLQSPTATIQDPQTIPLTLFLADPYWTHIFTSYKVGLKYVPHMISYTSYWGSPRFVCMRYQRRFQFPFSSQARDWLNMQ